jgi:hypothetical protein
MSPHPSYAKNVCVPSQRPGLQLREDAERGVVVQGLTEVPVTCCHEVMNILAQGATKRATGSTDMNADSSRSHAICTLTLKETNKGDTAAALEVGPSAPLIS